MSRIKFTLYRSIADVLEVGLNYLICRGDDLDLKWNNPKRIADACPTNTGRWTNAGLMLGHSFHKYTILWEQKTRKWRWPIPYLRTHYSCYLTTLPNILLARRSIQLKTSNASRSNCLYWVHFVKADSLSENIYSVWPFTPHSPWECGITPQRLLGPSLVLYPRPIETWLSLSWWDRPVIALIGLLIGRIL